MAAPDDPAAPRAAGPGPPGELPPAWRRPLWRPGGGDAAVDVIVLAPGQAELNAMRQALLAAALPPGIESQALTFADSPADFAALTGAPLGELIGVDGLEATSLGDAAAPMRAALRIAGSIPDPPDLAYLRGVVAMVGAAVETGGAIIVQPIGMRATTAEVWWTQVAAQDAPRGANHVAFMRVLEGAEKEAGFWTSTRGMRLFGRPDVSIHNVAPALLQEAADVMVLLCEWQIRGIQIPEGQPVTFSNALRGWVCRRRGALHDAVFHNVRIDVEPPGGPEPPPLDLPPDIPLA